jgi:hypothetical protein
MGRLRASRAGTGQKEPHRQTVYFGTQCDFQCALAQRGWVALNEDGWHWDHSLFTCSLLFVFSQQPLAENTKCWNDFAWIGRVRARQQRCKTLGTQNVAAFWASTARWAPWRALWTTKRRPFLHTFPLPLGTLYGDSAPAIAPTYGGHAPVIEHGILRLLRTMRVCMR